MVRTGTLNLPKNLKSSARDLVKNILVEDPTSRFEIQQIKDHGFFRGIDWEDIK